MSNETKAKLRRIAVRMVLTVNRWLGLRTLCRLVCIHHTKYRARTTTRQVMLIIAMYWATGTIWMRVIGLDFD